MLRGSGMDIRKKTDALDVSYLWTMQRTRKSPKTTRSARHGDAENIWTEVLHSEYI